MIRTVLAVTVFAFGVSAVVAQGDPIAARKALMKTNGDQNRSRDRDDRRQAAVRPRRGEEDFHHLRGQRRKGQGAVPRQLEDRRRHRRPAGGLGEQGGLRRQADQVRRRVQGGGCGHHRISTPSRRRSPRSARTAAAAIRPTARRRRKAPMRGRVWTAWHGSWAVTERRPPFYFGAGASVACACALGLRDVRSRPFRGLPGSRGNAREDPGRRRVRPRGTSNAAETGARGGHPGGRSASRCSGSSPFRRTVPASALAEPTRPISRTAGPCSTRAAAPPVT